MGFNPVPSTITLDTTYYDPSAAFAAPQIGVTVRRRITLYPHVLAGRQHGFVQPNLWRNRHQPSTFGLTQLRNLLAGTRAQPTPTTAVNLAQLRPQLRERRSNGSYFIPNGVADYSDTLSRTDTHHRATSTSTRLNQPTAGRWGEGQAVPGIPFTDPTREPTNTSVCSRLRTATRSVPAIREDHRRYPERQPARRRRRQLQLVRPLSRRMTRSPAQRTGEVDDQDAYDAAGRFLLPIDRIRRWVTPADINGTGAIRTWNATGSAGPGPTSAPTPSAASSFTATSGRPASRGDQRQLHAAADAGHVDLGPYPRVTEHDAGAIYYSVVGERRLLQRAVPPATAAPTAATAWPARILPPDVTNNPLHGFESFKVPNLGTAYGGTSNTRPGRQSLRSPGLRRYAGRLEPHSRDAGPPCATNRIATAYPTYDFSVNSNPSVRSDGLNEADEMNLYTSQRRSSIRRSARPTSSGSTASKTSTAPRSPAGCRSLAPISFTNPIDGQRRRRLFALDSWEMNNFVWANDNPRGTLPQQQPFTTGPTASMANLSTNAGSTVCRHRRWPIATRRSTSTIPLPVSNDPNEPIRQKWISDTYQLLKAILPPKAVDTAEELAQLSQYVINIVDFRDPDCTMTHWINPDVMLRAGVDRRQPRIHRPRSISTLASRPILATPTSQTFPLHQYGMEYNPVAINEAMAYSFSAEIGDCRQLPGVHP